MAIWQRMCLALVAGMGGTSALAQPAASPSPPTYEATFKPLPRSEREFAALGPVGPFYPQAAISQEGGRVKVIAGEALLECQIARSGDLDRCKVISATPLTQFGYAAKAMASQRRIAVSRGPSEGQIVRVHVPFEIGTPAQVAP
jgi:hypothetical protein